MRFIVVVRLTVAIFTEDEGKYCVAQRFYG